jgi:hypothetical protein
MADPYQDHPDVAPAVNSVWSSSGGATLWLPANGGAQPAQAVTASGDATGAADLAAIQAAHDALPSTGGAIHLGLGNFYLSGAVTLSKPVTVIGWGGRLSGDAGTTPAKALTTIYCTSPTADGFTVTAAGCVFEDFAMVNTAGSTPSAGAAIHDTAGSNSKFDGVTLLGFWNNLDIGGAFATVSACHFYDAINYNAYLHAATAPYNDNGVTYFQGCTFSGWNRTAVANAHIRYESGGGSKITGCYFVGGSMPGNVSAGNALYCVDLAIAAGVTTSSLTLTGNTFAAATTAMIRMSMISTTGGFTNLLINDNEIVTALGAGARKGIVLIGPSAAPSSLHEIEITGNVFNNLAGGGISSANCGGLHVGPNHWGRSMSGPLITLADTGDAGNGSTGVRIDRQSLGTLDAIDVVFDNRNPSIAHAGVSSTSHVLDGGIEYDYTRQILLTANGVWVTQWVLKVPRATGGVLEVELVGQNGSSGNSTGANRKGVYIKQLRSYDVSTADVVTLTTVGTDIANGAGGTFVALQYVLAANQITIQAQTTDVTQIWFGGEARVKVKGKLDTFHTGA